ncbi:hypothetical protein L9F63_012833, partial [Diploptera punctata]
CHGESFYQPYHCSVTKWRFSTQASKRQLTRGSVPLASSHARDVGREESTCPEEETMGAAGAGVPLGAVLASSVVRTTTTTPLRGSRPNPRTSRLTVREATKQRDAIYRGGGSTTSRGRSGLYYSPPGTSYTIVERPTTAPTPGKHPRGTYLGSSTTFNNTRANHHHHHHPGTNGKKRPISPEQVLRMFGTAGPPVGSNKMPGGRRSAVSSPASSPHNLNMHQDLVVRTVNIGAAPLTPLMASASASRAARTPVSCLPTCASVTYTTRTLTSVL